MKNQLDKAIRRVMAARHAEHRRAAVLVILALLTILSVSWRLHQVGIAMTDDEYSCGYEEHVHSDACYTEVLICGYEDGASETPADSAEEDGKTAPAAHSHTADCYQRVLTCTLPEHTHTLECLADITADVETPADWDEQSEGVSSFWSDAMTEIAQRQLGYTESAKNFTVDKALGETLAQAHHYTRYGDWYGNPYGSWDVMFVAFCQHYAGIPEDVIPQCASLLQLRTELENAHPEYITPGGSEATPGDIVLYTNAAGEETIGIVTAYDGANLTVVSGAVDGAVAAVTVAEADVTNTMELMLDSIKVYEYILQDGDWVKGEEVKDGVRVEKVEETASTRQYKFVLPDEKALVLEYSYKMNPGNLASDMAVKNTATLAGKIVGNQVSVKSDSASATVNNAVLTVSKTDSDTNLAITASPATFAIYHYNKTDSKWESIGTRQTTNGSFDLIFAQSPAADSSQLVIKDLYKLVETVPPTDYALDATPHYFIWNSTATDDDKKAAALTTATGATVLEGVTTANISFLGVNGDRATMAIPNKQNCLTLRKIWYGIGNDTIEAPVNEIQVQLYRYEDGKGKADAVAVGTPVSLTKADGWTKKISSLESGYHYYVEELGTGSGALIFYEVKYSESNDTGVTGGGSITITNKQKPSYELPATGAAGTPPYTAAGALIMGIALMLGYLINKRSHSGGGGKN